MSDVIPTEIEMTGSPLKQPREYVFVKLETQSVKHMHLGVTPDHGDLTICGQKIVGAFQWSQRATAMGKDDYCRDCERIWNRFV